MRKKPRPRRWARVGAVGLAVALVAGCGPAERQDHSPSSATQTTVGPVVTIRVGYLGDLAASGTVVSKAVEDGERLAVQQFAGGGHSVDVVLETASTGGTTPGAAAAARKLIADHVAAVVGPQSATEALGSGPVLAKAGIPCLSPTVTSTWLPSGSWAGFFRVVADDTQQGTAEADELVNNLGRRHIALVSGGKPGDTARVTAASTQIVADGGTVSTTIRPASPAAPVAPTTTADRVLASGADGVLISESGPMARSVVADLEAGGFQGSIMVAADVTVTPGVLTALGKSDDGAYVASPANDTSALASGGGTPLEFRDTYRAAFGRVPPAWAAEAYDATNFVLAGIAAGSTTAPQLSTYLSGHKWTGIAESLQFATGGVEDHPKVWVSQVQAGILTQLSSVS